ncbi:MAG: hypothetical protein HZA50_05020 [Planctomycetes bacterium]|nr:hypothetical protein [Planctomycetota bacterium]
MNASKNIFAQWDNPSSEYRSAPFWSWNAKLSPDRLCSQVESMHKAGMGGFFMHSRYGLKTPYLGPDWFECVQACIYKARQLDMKAYLYDEDRWPSGAAGGLVTRPHPEFRCQSLVMFTKPGKMGAIEHLSMFALDLDGEGKLKSYKHIEQPPDDPNAAVADLGIEVSEPSGWYNDGTYLDTMNRDAVAEFIRVTHQAYFDRYGDDFGTIIPAIFTDEPNYGPARLDLQGKSVVQWTSSLPVEFRKRRGYDMREHLPELFYHKAGCDFSRFRHDYYRTITELFVENFSAQIGKWCGRHKIALTGHMLEEPTLASQIRVIGAAMPHYAHMQWPGIDILSDQARELSTAKQTSSVADQLGKQRVLSELYGCTGWDWPLEGHKFVGDWQYAAGVNFRCPHLTHYSLEGGAKRDYPASIAWHSPWWGCYKHVEDYFGRLSLMLTQGAPVRDVLVIHPIESAWGCHVVGRYNNGELLGQLQDGMDKVMFSLTRGHYDWDFGDESLLKRHAKLAGPALKVGKMAYRLVVVPPSETLRAETVDLLKKFSAAGGKVVFAGRRPSLVDAAAPAGPVLTELISSAACCEVDSLISALEGALPRRVSITENGKEADFVWAMLRQVTGGQLLFMQSHDRKAGHKLHISVVGRRPVVIWDALTGKKVRTKAADAEKKVEFDVELPATGSALLSLGVPVPDAHNPPAHQTEIGRQEFSGPFEIALAEPNTLPLDYCVYRVGDRPWSDPVPTLKADEEIRKNFGLPPRMNRGHQPWYLYANNTIDVSPRGQAGLKWTFHVTDLPAKCMLAIEKPQDYRIAVNGRPAGKPDGFWVDEDIVTIDITGLLQIGKNEVELSFDYRPDMELEDAYLVGTFGVRKTAEGPGEPGDWTIVAPPTQLQLGSWVGQGLDFYGGSVKYRVRLPNPLPGPARQPAARRVILSLPGLAATAVVVHVGEKSFALPWAPFEADITDSLAGGADQAVIEIIGGRKNILGPLHTPWEGWTGPDQFNPGNSKWTRNYLLTGHGLTAPPIIKVMA